MMAVEEIAAVAFPGTTLLLKRVLPEDWPAILAMYQSFEPKAACMGLPPRREPERWLDKLREFPNFIVVDENRVAGHAALCAEDNSGEVAVFIHQDYRNRGLGKVLLRALIEEGRRMGLKRVWGMTEWDNVPMLRLARNLGFVSGEDPREFYLAFK